MSGEGRGRIGLSRDKRRGEERMGVEGGKRGGGSSGGGWSVMSPVLAVRACSETPPPRGTQPDPTRLDPPLAQTLAAPRKRVSDN